MIRLSCVAQNYAWGKPADESMVAALLRAQGADVDETRPFAELWMGTHPSGPSRVAADDQPLSDYIEANPDTCVDGSGLPFLFKVLSIAKALSIQAHPDKHLAEQLHAARPDIYKDDNHKPEMAIALTEFEALCGFRPLEEIVAHLRSVPELRSVVGEEVAEMFEEGVEGALSRGGGEAAGRALLPKLFGAFAVSSGTAVDAATSSLVERLSAAEADGSIGELDAVVLRLSRQFPGDAGCLAPLLLNYLKLGPGSALFLGANEPHAYISGDIVECMACSDNVVRAGLTPKFKDVDTLVSMLTYKSGRPAVLEGERVSEGVKLYRPPVPEFEVEAVELPAGGKASLAGFDKSSSILLCVDGGADARTGDASHSLTRGTVHFVCSSPDAVELNANPETGLRAFRVHVNGAQ